MINWPSQEGELRAEIDRLRAAVKHLGKIADICIYDTLGQICDGCRCKRRTT